MEITVKRVPGGRPHPDVVDNLLSDIRPALARGKAILNEGEALETVTLTALYRPGLEPGQLIEVCDSLQGKVWRGKVRSIEHEFSAGRLTSRLEIVRLAA
ncbi:MAG: hypothetical protein HY804_07115 [Nitrospinae bacterium]|nr:hypothetical protein [Nitrospinota bacterium]